MHTTTKPSRWSRRAVMGWGVAAGLAGLARAAAADWPLVGSDPARGPAVPDVPARRFSEHVWGVIAREAMPTEDNLGLFTNSYFIITRKGVVVYDTGASMQIGEMLIRQLRRITSKPVVAVINSHWHGDHWLGNQAFVEAFGRDLPIYALRGCREGTQGAIGEEWVRRLTQWTNQAIRGTQAVPPNRDLEHGQVLDFGDVRLRAHHYTPCHTPYDLSMEVIGEGVTLIGDVATNRRISNMEDGSFEGAIEYMKRIEAQTRTRLWCSGHGEPDASQVRWNRTLFEGIWEAALEAAKDAAGPEQAKALALRHPKVVATRPGTIGFAANIGKFCSLAYLEAEKKAF
ncbi:quinoprotein relay system zinc metallohydrolase 1 [Tepidimonas alkaliphilus]|uniref:Quinoprotein relay system zinc metallohydrolase 1 n=1 Tax=Tepidimonas alkaliphilus TaxID=2588942 RepID=A0A554WBI0_9BURK|nr:MBL fold metallo-hydrolase [Tepidimonas alkaliphilus]TSE20938.1 quinoprotein relay system zinc metallohydrolase 1 [Tepidimonas alkaliphilus]